MNKIRKMGKAERLSPTRMQACMRGAFMESLGHSKPVSPELQAIFDEGTRQHEEAQVALAELGLLTEVERELFNEEPPIYGKMDGCRIINNEPAVWEMKTTSTKPSDIKAPYPNHVGQAQLYMHMTGYKRAIIYYRSKNKSLPKDERGKEFIVEHDPEKVELLLDRGRYLLKCIRERALPLPDCYRCDNPACYDKTMHEREGIR